MIAHIACAANGIYIGASGLPGRIHVGNLALHQLEFADRLAELLAFVQEGDDDIHAAGHDAERAAAKHGAFVIEAGHQHFRAVADATQHIFFRHFAVVEEQGEGVRAAHAQLVEMGAVGEALHAFFDDEGSHAFGPGVRVGLGVNDQGIGVATVGNPHLGTVEDVARICPTSLFLGFQLHRDDIGTGIRLGHGECADVFAGDQLGQVFLALGPGAVAADLIDAKVGVGAVGETDRSRCPRNFFERDDVGKVAQIGAAVFLAGGHAEQAHVSEFFPEVGREFVGAVDFGSTWRDLGVGKRLHRITQQVDVFAEAEVEAGNVHVVCLRDGVFGLFFRLTVAIGS